MAQVSSRFYDLVIPKLYETVTITSDNKYRISYGSHPSQYHKSSALFDDDGNNSVDPDEPLYDNMKTRKDRAIEWCRRLVIDTPTEQLVKSVEYIADLLPHHRYGNVEELVFTRRAMRSPNEEEDTWWLSKILPTIAPIGTREEVCDQLPRTKRVVICLGDHYRCGPMLRHLSKWCKQRRNVRKPTQFAIHNIPFKSTLHLRPHERRLPLLSPRCAGWQVRKKAVILAADILPTCKPQIMAANQAIRRLPLLDGGRGYTARARTCRSESQVYTRK